MPIRQLKEWWNSPPVKDEPSTPETMSKQYQPTTVLNQNVSIVKSNESERARRPTSMSTDISEGRRISIHEHCRTAKQERKLSPLVYTRA